MKKKEALREYCVELKENCLPIQYDVALFCDCLKSIIPTELPEYLASFEKAIIVYASQIKVTRPKQFPPGIRVYIMDCRLNMLFAAHDETGKIATFISHFARETHRLEDYYFGDGEKFGDTNMIIRENVETHQSVLLSDYDERAMTAFTRRFGFLPIEELAAAHGLIFVEDELDDRVFLSPFQVALIMEKFHSKNLVNWKAIVSSY